MRIINNIFILAILILFNSGIIGQSTVTKVHEEGIIIPQGIHQNILNPEEGLMMYDIQTLSFWYFNGVSWKEVGIDTDTDPNNELQSISASIIGDTMYLSNGGFLIVPGISNANYIKDGDGNVYEEVEILGQVWLKPNLRSTKYNDGTSILSSNTLENFLSLGSNSLPTYVWYDNDSSTYAEDYGALYNWFVVDENSNGGKNICPIGYRVPTITEIFQLRDTLDPSNTSLVGHHLKTVGYDYWLQNGGYGLDTYGFNGKGAGRAVFEFQGFKSSLYFWTNTDYVVATQAYYASVNSYNSGFNQNGLIKHYGISIRCIKE